MDGRAAIEKREKVKRTWLIGVAVLVLATFAGGLYFATAGHAPPGQAPLVVIDSHALSTLQEEFNRTAPGVRVILLLSPT